MTSLNNGETKPVFRKLRSSWTIKIIKIRISFLGSLIRKREMRGILHFLIAFKL
jgi:hypothetical protein